MIHEMKQVSIHVMANWPVRSKKLLLCVYIKGGLKVFVRRWLCEVSILLHKKGSLDSSFFFVSPIRFK